MIDEEVRVANEWWNALKLNHNEYSVRDSSLWRVQVKIDLFVYFVINLIWYLLYI